MTDTIKIIGIGIAGVVVGLLLAGIFQGASLGGVYSITEQTFDDVVINDDLTVADDVTFGSSSATTSTNLGRACITLTESDGGTVYWYANASGDLATSSTSCN